MARLFVTSDGYMLTNHHVIEGADKITVTLNDRTELDVTLVGSDERSDVAVLKVAGSKFPALPIGDSNALKVGSLYSLLVRHSVLIIQHQRALSVPNHAAFHARSVYLLSKPMWHSTLAIQVVHCLTSAVK